MRCIGSPAWLEKDIPVCGPLDAIIQPTMVAVCSSDTHILHGGFGEHKDLILGHEAVGIVAEVGSMVRGFRPGDYVVVPCSTPDWLSPTIQSTPSNAHDRGLMQSFKFIGSKDGIFAERFHVNQADANLALLPDGVTPEQALMTVDMMSTGYHGVELAEIGFGDTVVVIGIGPVGLMALSGAAIRGAGRIIAVGTRKPCVEAAVYYGATDIISYKAGDIADQVLEMTKGGADKVIIAGGSAETFTQAVRMTREMGTVANVNFFDHSETLGFPAMLWGVGMANKDIRGGFCPGGARRIQKMLALIQAGRVDPARIISHKLHGFTKLPEAVELMDSKSPELIKPIVYFDDLA
jgi:threonine dehydrogenase-like Zn-dependent dehydrogenase